MPGLGCTMARAGALLSPVGPTRGCHVPCRAPELLRGQPTPLLAQAQGTPGLEQILPWGVRGGWHGGGPSKPPGNEGPRVRGLVLNQRWVTRIRELGPGGLGYQQCHDVHTVLTGPSGL